MLVNSEADCHLLDAQIDHTGRLAPIGSGTVYLGSAVSPFLGGYLVTHPGQFSISVVNCIAMAIRTVLSRLVPSSTRTSLADTSPRSRADRRDVTDVYPADSICLADPAIGKLVGLLGAFFFWLMSMLPENRAPSSIMIRAQ